VVKPKEEEVVVEENIVLLTEIRDLLRKDSK
ncbi:TPA: large conductance mechanosensitive channel protein MscL, partial [Staphylococcus pseudintermedius]